jgi:hypothetical protein
MVLRWKSKLKPLDIAFGRLDLENQLRYPRLRDHMDSQTEPCITVDVKQELVCANAGCDFFVTS